MLVMMAHSRDSARGLLLNLNSFLKTRIDDHWFFLNYFLLCLNKMIPQVIFKFCHYFRCWEIQAIYSAMKIVMYNEITDSKNEGIVSPAPHAAEKELEARESGGERTYIKVYWIVSQGFSIFFHFWILCNLTCSGFDWRCTKLR